MLTKLTQMLLSRIDKEYDANVSRSDMTGWEAKALADAVRELTGEVERMQVEIDSLKEEMGRK